MLLRMCPLENTSVALLLLFTAAWSPPTCAATEVAVLPRGFAVHTSSLELEVRDGAIVRLVNQLTGEVHTDADSQGFAMPTDIGTVKGQLEAMRALHSPWGSTPIMPRREQAVALPSQHAPDARWQFSAVAIESGIRAQWQTIPGSGPRETFTIEATVSEPDGSVMMKASGESPAGICGLTVPIVNLHAKHGVYVSSFGGIRYDGQILQGLVSLSSAPFAEAPAIAIEGLKGSVGFWIGDDHVRPYFLFVGGDRKTMAVGIESLQLMPYESITHAESSTWRITATSGDWTSALQPYRDWYASAFAKELEARSTIHWADSIEVILDEVDLTRAAYAAIARQIPPTAVLVHEWNARKLPFGVDLPDWTPRPKFLEQVRMAHDMGFRAMSYVNTYCVNVASPLYTQDHVAEFGLARPLAGPWDYGKPHETFAAAKPGQMLYLDPLSKRWRQYHVDAMERWVQTTGCDALYEDVGGTAGDFGNGTVGGLAGAQGGTAQFRELQTKLPAIPIATEFAPDHMAFASHWPLRYQQVWGDSAVHDAWLTTQRPVACFLHGGRPWVPIINAVSERKRMLVTACSDALGGLAQFPATEVEMQARAGMGAHMVERAVLFAQRQLKPIFEPQVPGAIAICTYQAGDGEKFRYTTSKTIQQLLDANGRPVYQRVFGADSIESPLRVLGWPGIDGNRTVGLNPVVPYALSRMQSQPTAICVRTLPSGTFIARYEETPSRTVLVIDRPIREGKVDGNLVIETTKPFLAGWLDGKAMTVPAPGARTTMPITVFPSTLVLASSPAEQTAIGETLGRNFEPAHYILSATGIERGGTYVPTKRSLWTVPNIVEPQLFFFLNGGSNSEISLDYFTAIPSANAAIEVLFRSTSLEYGNGSVAIVRLDGVPVAKIPMGTPATKGSDPSDYGTQVVRCVIPLGHRAGQSVAISVASDGCNDDNADELWCSRPRLIRDPAQKQRIEAMGEPAPER